MNRSLVWGALLSLLMFEASAHSALAGEAALLQSIRSAWSARRASIQSYRYRVLVEEVSAVPQRPLPGGVFQTIPRDEPLTTQTVRYRFDYATSGQRWASRETGERWELTLAAKAPVDQREIFDGSEKRTLRLLPGERGAFGTMQVGEQLHIPLPRWPIMAWADTEQWLQQAKVEVDETQVESTSTMYGDADCVVLLLARGRRDPVWRTLLYVDRSRDYVPVHYRIELHGVPLIELSIEYSADPACGWVVAGWEQRDYRQSTTPQMMRVFHKSVSAVVTRRAVNAVLPQALFRIDFPAETRVKSEVDGQVEFFYISPDGHWVPLSFPQFIEPGSGRI